MYLNKFKSLSKQYKKNLNTNSLSEAQVSMGNLLGFQSVNAVSASLKKATGKISKSSLVKDIELPTEFKFTAQEFRSEPFKYTPKKPNVSRSILDIQCLCYLMEENFEKLGSHIFNAVTISVDNDEYILSMLEYHTETGITLHVETVDVALANGRVESSFVCDVPTVYIDMTEAESKENRSQIELIVNGEYVKNINLEKQCLSVSYFNSPFLESLSESEEVSLHRQGKALHENFGLTTYNDLIELSKGIEDQPFLISNGNGDTLESICVCYRFKLVDGLPVISTYQKSYASYSDWNTRSINTEKCMPTTALFWKELSESIKTLPTHLRSQPVRFELSTDYMQKQHVVPIGVWFSVPLFADSDPSTGRIAIVKPR